MSESCEWIKVPGFCNTYDIGCNGTSICSTKFYFDEIKTCPQCGKPVVVKDDQ